MSDVRADVASTLSAAMSNWQRVQITACTAADIVVQMQEVSENPLPGSGAWCPTVKLDACVETVRRVALDENVKFWFAVTDSACREKPLIMKSSVESGEITIDRATGQAVIHLLPKDTCCFSSRLREFFFTLLLNGAPELILARAQGSLIVEPNTFGTILRKS